MDIRDFLKNKIIPVVVVLLMAVGIIVLTEILTPYAKDLFIPETINSYRWAYLHLHHLIQMFLAMILMLLMGGGYRSYGFNLKSDNLYIWPAIFVGVLFGVIMTLVDHVPTIISGAQITGWELTTTNVVGWLSFEWIFAGLSEEIFIRGLMMTYLMTKFSGHVRFFKWDVHVAGVIIAGLFALMHISTFWSGNLIYAIGQQIYAFILGLCYAYFFEKSRSLLSPIISHNISNGVEYVILFILIWLGY